MRLKKIILLFIAIIFSVSGYSQITFQKTFRGSLANISDGICQTFDGGFAFTGGYFYNPTVPYAEILLIKLNNLGDTVWTRTFGSPSNNDGGRSIQQTTDGGYIICGFIDSIYENAFLVKVDSVGNIIWSKAYGGALDDMAYSVQETSDGGYIFTGYTNSFGAGNKDIFVVKTDSTGDTLWTRTFGGSYDDAAYSIHQTIDGGYIIGGYTASFPPAGGTKIYLIKTDGNGNLTWNKIYGNNRVYEVRQTVDGGYIIIGSIYLAPADYISLIKTDANGNVSWAKHFNAGSSGYSGNQTIDGGYIIAGVTTNFGGGGQDIYLIKTDALGNLSWSKTIGSADDEWPNHVIQTSDGGYVINAVNISSYNGIYVIKTDSSGNTVCDQTSPPTTVSTLPLSLSIPTPSVSFGATVTIPAFAVSGYDSVVTNLCISTSSNELSNQRDILLFPNPATSELRIESVELKIRKIEIYSWFGETFFSQQQTTNDNLQTIDVGQLPSGFYFITVTDRAGNKVTKKLVKM